MNSQQLEAIQHADESIGPDLQLWPAAYQHRRDLLAHLAEDALLVKELSAMLEPYSGGAQTLAEIVARMKMAQEIRREVMAAMEAQETPPPEPKRVPARVVVEFQKCEDGDCSRYRNNNGGCDACGAPCL